MTVGEYVISDEQELLQLEVIHHYLCNESYWAAGIPFATVKQAVEHSLNIGVYLQQQQVGFARLVTDYTTFAWLCDVFVLEAHRGKGLSKAMMQFIMNHPRLQGLRSILLGTRDAHGLYTQFGFAPLPEPSRFLGIRRPDIYLQQQEPVTGGGA